MNDGCEREREGSGGVVETDFRRMDSTTGQAGREKDAENRSVSHTIAARLSSWTLNMALRRTQCRSRGLPLAQIRSIVP